MTEIENDDSAMSAQTAPSLPSREQPKGSAELPSRSGSEQHQADVAATTEATAPRTRADRIRVATAQGGLTELPARFDDSHGDWESVLSPSLFERLYLDAAQHAAITPAMVLGNYAILRSFWDEKIAAMQTGAAKTQILIKFGGEHRSEDVVLSYRRELKKAAEQLSAPDGVAAYHQQLERDRIESAHRVLAPIIEFILVDDALEPVESEGFFNHAVAAGLTLDEAATLLQAALEERRFKPVATPSGQSLHEKLRSVQWVSEARLATMRATRAAVASTQDAPKPEPRTTLVIPPPEALAAGHLPSSSAPPRRAAPIGIIVFVIAIGVPLLILLVGSALAMMFRSASDTTTSQSTAAQTETTEHAAATTSAFPIPAMETTGEQPTTDTAAEELERMKRQAAAAARARQEAAEREETERREAEEHRIAALREEMANAIGKATERIAAHDFGAARELLDPVRPKAVSDPTFMSEQIEIDRLLTEANRGATQLEAFKVRLSEAETMNANGKFDEAIAIASRLLAEPGLPANISDGAKIALAFAEEKKNAAEAKGKRRFWHRSKSR